MSSRSPARLFSAQQWTLIALRTVVGWHFLYEGYYKFALPAWGVDGAPLARWTAAGYLRAGSGPLARLLHAALPLMHTLAETIHQSCHLVVMHEGRAIVIAQVDAPGEIGFAVRVGAIIMMTMFLMMWAVLVIIGSFFRGEGFNFVFPWNKGVFFEL